MAFSEDKFISSTSRTSDVSITYDEIVHSIGSSLFETYKRCCLVYMRHEDKGEESGVQRAEQRVESGEQRERAEEKAGRKRGVKKQERGAMRVESKEECRKRE
jgi:hypothetical protein